MVKKTKPKMTPTVTIPKEEYKILKNKAKMFDRFIETEELTEEELAKVNKAMKGPLLSEAEFLKRHPGLE